MPHDGGVARRPSRPSTGGSRRDTTGLRRARPHRFARRIDEAYARSGQLSGPRRATLSPSGTGCSPRPTPVSPASGSARPRSRMSSKKRACSRATIYGSFRAVGTSCCSKPSDGSSPTTSPVWPTRCGHARPRGVARATARRSHRTVPSTRCCARSWTPSPSACCRCSAPRPRKTLPFIADFLHAVPRPRGGAPGRLRPGVDLERTAEYLARSIISLIGTPGRWDLDDPKQIAEFRAGRTLGRHHDHVNAQWHNFPRSPRTHRIRHVTLRRSRMTLGRGMSREVCNRQRQENPPSARSLETRAVRTHRNREWGAMHVDRRKRRRRAQACWSARVSPQDHSSSARRRRRTRQAS